MKQQLEIYQVTRQQKSLAKIDLRIVYDGIEILSVVNTECRASESLDKSLITAWWIASVLNLDFYFYTYLQV